MIFEPKPFVDAVRRACLVHRGAKELDKFPGVEFGKRRDGTIAVRASDGEIAISATLTDLDSDKSDLVRSFLLPSPQLYALVNNADAKWKQIEMVEAGDSVEFRMGTIKSALRKVRGTPATIPSIDPDKMVDAPMFGKNLDLVAWARNGIGQGPTTGVLLSPTCIAATNKFAAAVYLMDNGIDLNYLLPAQPVRNVFAGLTDAEIETCQIGATDYRFFIAPTPGVQYSFPMIEEVENYPPLEAMFRKEGMFNATKHLDPIPIAGQAMGRILRRLQSAGGDERGLKVELEFNGDEVKVSSMQGVVGDYCETIKLETPLHLDYPIVMLAENFVNVLSRLPAKGGVMHLPADEKGGDIRFQNGDHWMLLGRVIVS